MSSLAVKVGCELWLRSSGSQLLTYAECSAQRSLQARIPGAPISRQRHLKSKAVHRKSQKKAHRKLKVAASNTDSGGTYPSDLAKGPSDAQAEVNLDEERLAAKKEGGFKGWFRNLQLDAKAARAQVAKLGLAAVLAYGLLDGVTYTIAFTLAFLGYERSTGLNPARNLKSLLGIVVLMWTSNNVTRPLRVTAAAAAAPFVDRFLKRLQKTLNLPNQIFAFAITVAAVAGTCLSIAGLLILSRLGR